MAVYPRCSAMLLQFLHHFKAHALPLVQIVRKTQHFSVRSRDNLQRKWLESVVTFDQVFLVLIDRISHWSHPTKINHTRPPVSQLVGALHYKPEGRGFDS
jgi:hypothetical protein